MIKIVRTGARVFLGLVYFVFGGMGLGIVFGLIKMPEQPMSDAAKAFFGGIMAAGYFFPLLKTTETVCGFLLLIGRAVPLALVILAPVTLNIIFFHFFLTPGSREIILPVAIVLAHVLAAGGYWRVYQPLFGSEN